MSAKMLDMSTNLPVVEVVLQRGDAGLGFNIKGGIDDPLFAGLDTGIFVTKLKENGAAYKDKRIKEGDKILEVNGKDIRGLNHGDAVQTFISAGETVVLKLQHGAETHIVKMIEKKNQGFSNGIKWAMILGAVAAAAAAAGFVIMNQKNN